MLTVAPSGTTNRAIGTGTRPVLCTHRKVMGMVAALEEQANAMVWALCKYKEQKFMQY